MITIEMQDGKKIEIELFENDAPVTAKNFIELVQQGFYDGLVFHRVIEGFMVQGGCPKGSGTGGSGKNIKGEFSKNGVENNIKHTRGTLSMARSSLPDSASSQFFIVHKDSHFLDGSYAAFGRVVNGMEVVDEIAACEVDHNDRPVLPQVIKTVTYTP